RTNLSAFDRLAPLIYDLGAPAVFSFLGGLDALREQVLDLLNVKRGQSVLELGCGTGALTEKLLRRGALVTAVERLEPMILRAHRRAPGATFVLDDILNLPSDSRFDHVLLAFVLHH